MSELRLISRHAGTILVGQLAVMAFGVADTLIAVLGLLLYAVQRSQRDLPTRIQAD